MRIPKVFKLLGVSLGIAITINSVDFCGCVDFFSLISIFECIGVVLSFELLFGHIG
jgi:hypothetical protein